MFRKSGECGLHFDDPFFSVIHLVLTLGDSIGHGAVVEPVDKPLAAHQESAGNGLGIFWTEERARAPC